MPRDEVDIVSRHLPECAGDDYCNGNCRYDGIAQKPILERASDISCECDWRLLHHDPDCPDSPAFWETLRLLNFNPWCPIFTPIKFWQTWQCVQHGLLGDINGPVHYEVCHG